MTSARRDTRSLRVRLWGALLLVSTSCFGAEPEVKVLRLPEGALQPQVVPGSHGSAHLLYFKGPADAGDIHYVRLPDATGIPEARRVNRHDRSAVALGTVRGPQIAVGAKDRVHVAWNGSKQAQPTAPGDAVPLLYTRMGDDGEFEPERNLITSKVGLDGGGALAADSAGCVYVSWHAPEHKKGNEQDRRVYVAVSADEGKTFAPETAATDGASGVCACCGMGGLAVGDSTFILYRGAARVTDRATYLLFSKDAGATFRSTKLHPMEMGMCIMSTYALAPLPDGNALAVWETLGRIFAAKVSAATGAVGPAIAMPAGSAKQKHPAVGVAASGKILIAWAEGTGFRKGGEVAWQMLDADLKPIGGRETAPGLLASSFPAVWARGDQSFIILY